MYELITWLHLAIQRRSFLKLTLVTLVFLMRHRIVFNLNCLKTMLCYKIDSSHAHSVEITQLCYSRTHAWGFAWDYLWMIVDSRSKSKPSKSFVLCSFRFSVQNLAATHWPGIKQMTINLKSSLDKTSWSSGWGIISLRSLFKGLR